MAEYGYGYRTQFDKPTPLTYKGIGIPEFTKPGAKVSISSAAVSNLLSKLPMKDSSIPFSIQLEANEGSDVSKAIDPSTDVQGANPTKRKPDDELYATRFEEGALPKLQSFKAALHSKNKNRLLAVGGRIAGLHPFGNGGFQQVKQNFALFVIDMDPDNKRKCVTAATALPGQYFNTMALMNSQATQVIKDGKNYLVIAGGYGYDPTIQDMKTFDTLTVLDVDGMVDSIWEAAHATEDTVPHLENFIWQTHHEDLQVTGGVMMFNPASNEPGTPVSLAQDHLYLVVGQTFKVESFIFLQLDMGSYGSESHDTYTYIRGMRKFAVPYPTGQGGTALPPIVVTEITATIDTCNSPDYDGAMSSQLARRDLNVVPTFLPGTFQFEDGKAKAYPGATILSGVFNQDGSNAPYLQPIHVNFNQGKMTRDSNPAHIPVFSSRPFFQLFNNYDCCNLQLFSTENQQGYIYNVLCGGVSFFYKTENDRFQLDQVNDLFKAPFTTDISIIKQDNHGHFTQRLAPPTKTTADFLKKNKLSMFGTESFFIPNPAIPLTKALPESSGVLDLNWIRAKKQPKYKLGTMYGGIENIPSAYPPPYPPSFQPESTDATSRMVDIYITFPRH